MLEGLVPSNELQHILCDSAKMTWTIYASEQYLPSIQPVSCKSIEHLVLQSIHCLRQYFACFRQIGSTKKHIPSPQHESFDAYIPIFSACKIHQLHEKVLVTGPSACRRHRRSNLPSHAVSVQRSAGHVNISNIHGPVPPGLNMSRPRAGITPTPRAWVYHLPANQSPLIRATAASCG